MDVRVRMRVRVCEAVPGSPACAAGVRVPFEFVRVAGARGRAACVCVRVAGAVGVRVAVLGSSVRTAGVRVRVRGFREHHP